MKKLNKAQLKSLSQYLNTIAASWFTIGVITTIVAQQVDLGKALVLAIAA